MIVKDPLGGAGAFENLSEAVFILMEPLYLFFQLMHEGAFGVAGRDLFFKTFFFQKFLREL